MTDTKSQLALPYLFKKKRIKALPLDWKCHFCLALNVHKCVDSSGFLRARWLPFFSCQHHTVAHSTDPHSLDRPGRTPLSSFFRSISFLPVISSTWILGSVWWVSHTHKKNPPSWDFDWDCHWTYINSKRMKSSGYWILPLLNVTFLSINCEDLLCFSERVYDTQHLNPLIFCQIHSLTCPVLCSYCHWYFICIMLLISYCCS